MFLFFSVARSQEIGSWERAAETAQINTAGAVAKPAPKVAAPKNGFNPNFGTNMPLMCSAFDTSMWLNAA
ncbi:MAG TPA: hypothetical protein PKO45_04550 [Rubrivivax sp.]|nr:hypothetical protein [Burkholderiales bacterium]HNT38373.1 hypothetical protein [Rubrivivax sp.]